MSKEFCISVQILFQFYQKLFRYNKQYKQLYCVIILLRIVISLNSFAKTSIQHLHKENKKQI